MKVSSLQFAAAARALGRAAREQRLLAPGFRSPPRLAGVERTLRRRPDGGATVSVQLRDRPLVAVVADMVEGVVVANRLAGPAATRARTALWDAITSDRRLEAA